MTIQSWTHSSKTQLRQHPGPTHNCAVWLSMASHECHECQEWMSFSSELNVQTKPLRLQLRSVGPNTRCEMIKITGQSSKGQPTCTSVWQFGMKERGERRIEIHSRSEQKFILFGYISYIINLNHQMSIIDVMLTVESTIGCISSWHRSESVSVYLSANQCHCAAKEHYMNIESKIIIPQSCCNTFYPQTDWTPDSDWRDHGPRAAGQRWESHQLAADLPLFSYVCSVQAKHWVVVIIMSHNHWVVVVSIDSLILWEVKVKAWLG